MTELKKGLPFRRRAEGAAEREKRDLAESLAQTGRQIQQAYRAFNSVYDPDLIEAAVYEIDSLQARYAYLLRRVKELDEV